MNHREILNCVTSALADIYDDLPDGKLREQIGGVLWFVYDNTDGVECVMMDELQSAKGEG